MKKSWEMHLNALLVLIISGVLLSAYIFQFVEKEEPCPLCMLQRLGMIGVAIGALMNLKWGIRPSHYGLSLLSAITGGFVALRQISLHVCPGSSTFGTPVFGLSLYTWSFIVFVCSVAYIALLQLIFDRENKITKPEPLNWFSTLAFAALFLIACANIITTLIQCGLGPCEG